MSNFLNSKTIENSSYLVSYALQSVAEEFNYYDISFPEAKILFGNNLNKSVIYLSACLSVCGFKFYCQRQRNGRYKMMFSKNDTHRFISSFFLIFFIVVTKYINSCIFHTLILLNTSQQHYVLKLHY